MITAIAAFEKATTCPPPAQNHVCWRLLAVKRSTHFAYESKLSTIFDP